jgi:hypothetical protein
MQDNQNSPFISNANIAVRDLLELVTLNGRRQEAINYVIQNSKRVPESIYEPGHDTPIMSYMFVVKQSTIRRASYTILMYD